MRRLSSTDTKTLKRFVPKMSFGLALLFVIISAVWMLREGRFVRELALVPLALAAVGGLMNVMFGGLVDEVWDDGDAFVVREAGIEVRIPITAIRSVIHSTMQSPPAITLTLFEPTCLGTEIAFMADADHLRSLTPRSRIFDEIRKRIADQRRV